MEPTQHPLFFTSPTCPDFSTAGNTNRPPQANSQTGKILTALIQGQRLTTLTARLLTGSENAKARISEARAWLEGHGLTLQQRDVVTDSGKRIKEHWLEARDRVALRNLMKDK